MRQDIEIAVTGRRLKLDQLELPLDLRSLLRAGVPSTGPSEWELEIGFGKGRYLLKRAEAEPAVGFVGIEIAGRYQRLAARRAARRGLSNVLLARGEALYLLAAVLPTGFARAVHVYFPDPWPKNRHHKRRFLDRDHVDLTLSALKPGGALYFATDFIDFGEQVAAGLEEHPGFAVERHEGPWPEGPKTNYEAKYVSEGRPILRLTAKRVGGLDRARERGPEELLHPAALVQALVGPGS